MQVLSADGAEQLPETIGPYEIVKVLSRGGMGTVFWARHSQDLSPVAIKVLAPDLASDPTAAARFANEGRAVSLLIHPNIGRVLACGADDKGAPYIVMEYIDGASLAELIRNRREFPFSRVMQWMTEAAQGLQAAFKQKIIHGDVKPGNLMVAADNVLKVIDFGLARRLFEKQDPEQAAESLGTPAYMAPEQSLGQTVDHRSDIYSLGCSFYHLIAGQPPFEAKTASALAKMHVQTPLTPLYVVNPKVPAELAETIHRMMSKDPSDRFQDYEEAIATLRQVHLSIRAKEGGTERSTAAEAPAATFPEPPLRQAAGAERQTVPFAHSGAAASSGGAAAPYGGGRAIPPLSLDAPAPAPLLPKLIGAGVVLLVLAVVSGALLSGGDDQSGAKRSVWSRLAAKFLGANPGEAEKDALKSEDEKMAATADAMEIIYAICMKHYVERSAFPRSMNDLTSADMATEDEVLDGFGQRFITNPSNQTVISPGADGIEKTADDFVIGGKGFLKKPASLLEREAEEKARERKTGGE